MKTIFATHVKFLLPNEDAFGFAYTSVASHPVVHNVSKIVFASIIAAVAHCDPRIESSRSWFEVG